MVVSTWESRDLPVLEAVVELFDAGEDYLDPDDLVTKLQMPEETVSVALKALGGEHPPFFQTGDNPWLITGVTGHARRTVGSWPNPELAASRLVSALDKAADEEPDEEKKGWLRKTAGYLGSAGKDVAVEVAAAVINRQIGGA